MANHAEVRNCKLRWNEARKRVMDHKCYGAVSFQYSGYALHLDNETDGSAFVYSAFVLLFVAAVGTTCVAAQICGGCLASYLRQTQAYFVCTRPMNTWVGAI